MHRETFTQLETQLGRAGRQIVEVGPRTLGIDMVGCHRRDPAPVISTGPHEKGELGRVAEVRRNLDACIRAHRQARSRHCGDVLLQLGIRRVPHRGPGLRAEVLHDDLLQVSVATVRVPQSQQGVGAVADRLADPHEDAGRERNAVDAGFLDHPKPDVGILVGGPIVHLSRGLEQLARRRLEHHAHRWSCRAQPLKFVGAHDAGVQMREHAGLGRDEAGDVRDVVEGRGETVLVEPTASLGPSFLGAVAEREQSLLAALALAGAGDGEHLLGAHEHRLAGALQLSGGIDEHAVVAAVPAEGRDRHEHLAGVGEDSRASSLSQAVIPQVARNIEDRVQVRPARREHRDQIVAAEVVARLGS